MLVGIANSSLLCLNLAHIALNILNQEMRELFALADCPLTEQVQSVVMGRQLSGMAKLYDKMTRKDAPEDSES